jgi:hypothetical protein
MFYLDTSVLVASVSAEAPTAAVLAWMAAHEEVSISDWGITESVAALSVKRRMRVISAEEHGRAIVLLRDAIGAALPSLLVTRSDFEGAARFAERSETGLRAGDALHLAIASGASAKLVTLDKAQARAGKMLELRTLLLGSDHPATSA